MSYVALTTSTSFVVLWPLQVWIELIKKLIKKCESQNVHKWTAILENYSSLGVISHLLDHEAMKLSSRILLASLINFEALVP